eukprot:7751440-Prorocentrum_lima.AAC.1
MIRDATQLSHNRRSGRDQLHQLGNEAVVSIPYATEHVHRRADRTHQGSASSVESIAGTGPLLNSHECPQ